MEQESLDPTNPTAPPAPPTAPKKRWRVGLLDDPNVAQTLEEDPIFRLLAKYWSQIALGLAAILVVFYVKGKFEGTYERAMSDSSALYSNVSKEFEAYNQLFWEIATLKAQASETPADKKEESANKIKVTEDKLQESGRRLREYLNALRFKREPYNQIAGIYLGVLEALSGNIAAAKSELQNNSWDTVDKKSENRFYAELRALVLARAILDDAALYSQGRSSLKLLVEKGVYVAASAALTFSRISTTEEEKREAKEVLGSFVSARSEQREVLKDELKRLGL